MEKPYEIGVSPDETYIYARVFKQPYTAQLAFKIAEEMVAFRKILTILGCLIDIRGTKSVSSVVDKYKFAHEKAPTIGLPRHWQIAFLIDEGDDSPDFIETVMKNAGYMFQVFNNEHEALDWLRRSISN